MSEISIADEQRLEKVFGRFAISACSPLINIDLRGEREAFDAEVNETQQGVIRNRLAKDCLADVGGLPNAAKNKFVLPRVKRVFDEVSAGRPLELMRTYDAKYHAHLFAILGQLRSSLDLSHIRKRGVTGVFVWLPVFDVPLSVDRLMLPPYGGGSKYWDEFYCNVMMTARDGRRA